MFVQHEIVYLENLNYQQHYLYKQYSYKKQISKFFYALKYATIYAYFG